MSDQVFVSDAVVRDAAFTTRMGVEAGRLLYLNQICVPLRVLEEIAVA